MLYPVSAHLSIFFNLPIALWHLVVLLGNESIAARNNDSRKAMFWFGLIAVIIALIASSKFATPTLLFLPALISGWVLIIFARTLVGQRTALITRFVELTEENITDEVRQYTRNVTVAWTVVLKVLTVEALLLAIFSSHATWSLFTNLLNYVFLLAVFAIEYFYRVHRFPERPHKSFSRFVTGLPAVKWSALKNSGAERKKK